MPRWLEQILERIRSFYRNLNQQQRTLLLAGSALLVLGVAGFVLMATRPDYVVLYSNLSKNDGQRISQRLDSLNVPYKLSKDGTAILVARPQVDKLRVQLAQEGLPTTQGVGLEYLDKPSIYDTDPTLKAKYLRAQQTELQRTISQMEGVRWVRVHLVLPQQSVFVEKEKEPTAAVEIQLEPGTQLNPKQVRAIVSLVAHSVEGLRPENVTVVDTEGNLLTDMLARDESPEKLTLSQLEIQQHYEKQLQAKLQSMLDNTLGLTQDGFHKAFVQVKAELDFEAKTIEQTTYIPTTPDGKGIVRSQESNREYLNGTKPVGGGIPGTTSNVPGYPAATLGPVRYTKEQSVVNVEISSKKEQIKPPVGVETKQLHVAVAVDSSVAPSEMQRVKNLIQSEAGINTARGDSLAVEPLRFDLSYRKKLQKEIATQESAQRWMYAFTHFVLPFILIAAVIGIAVAYFARRPARPEEAVQAMPAGPPPIPPEFLAPPPPPPVEEELGERKKMLELLKQKGETASLLSEEVKEFLNANPQAAAELIRSWLAEKQQTAAGAGGGGGGG